MHALTSSFIPHLKNSCITLLGLADNTPTALTNRMEVIRALMLSELGEYGEKKFPAVTRRVRYAPDVQGLWYARSDVMAILANTHGETVARQKISDISNRFEGLVPKSLMSKAGLRAR